MYSAGQSRGDSIIIRAMQDELKRTFNEFNHRYEDHKFSYMRYMAYDISAVRINASMGALTTPIVKTGYRYISPIILFNDTMQHSYVKNSVYPLSWYRTDMDTVYNSIRRYLWDISDVTYKKKYPDYVKLLSSDKVTNTDKSQEILEKHYVVRVPNTHKTDYRITRQAVFDTIHWVNTAKSVSEEFEKYPFLHNTYIDIYNYNNKFYSVSSEDITLQIPYQGASFKMEAYISDKDGITDSMSITRVVTPGKSMPAKDDLKKDVNTIAKTLKNLSEAPAFNEYYNGPVLVEKEAVAKIFQILFLSYSNIIYGITGFYQSSSNTDYTGKKILDSRLSVFAYGNMADSVDYEGFPKTQKITFAEKGVLKTNFLSQIMPAKNSYPFGMTIISPPVVSESLFTQNMYLDKLHITADDPSDYSDIQKQLISLAKKSKLKHVYIIRNEGSKILLYRKYIKSGKEELLRNHSALSDLCSYYFSGISILNPLEYVQASKEEYSSVTPLFFDNNNAVIITVPKAILFQNISITPYINSYLRLKYNIL